MNAPALRATLFGILWIAACRADRITTGSVPVLHDADAWSGGTLVLRSPAFRGADTLPIITAGPYTLGVRSLGPDSVLVHLPDTNGPVELWARFGHGGGGSVGVVQVHGIAERIQGASDWTGSALPWMDVAMLGYAAGRVSRLDLFTGNATALLPDSGDDWYYCLGGLMPSLVPGLVVVSHHSGSQCGPLIAVPLGAVTEPPDTGPTPTRQDFGPALHLARGRWLADMGDGLRFISGSPSTGFVAQPVVQLIGRGLDIAVGPGFAVSPKGDRIVAVPSTSYGLPGIPVLDPTSSDVAYDLDGAAGADGAAFSAGGDTLFVAVGNTPRELWAVDAASGSVLARAGLHVTPGYGPLAVTVDPLRPLVYVTGIYDGLNVEVFDRRTLAPMARLRAPPGRPDLGGGYGTGFAAVVAGRELYVISYPDYLFYLGGVSITRIDLTP